MKTIIYLTLLLIIYPHQLTSQQNDAALQNKYWSYRDQFRKHFMYIGAGPGRSLTMTGLFLDGGSWPEGVIQYGDVMAFHGDYMAVLATELYLLNLSVIKDNATIKATENELYYAIEAVNRVDFEAEKYYGQTGKKDGFFIRTDVPNNFYEKWETLGDKMYAVRSDCSNGRNPQVENNPSPDFENPFATRVKRSAKGLPLDKDGNEIFARQITTRYNHENL